MMGTWWKRCDRRTDRQTDGRTDGLNQSYSCLVAAKNSSTYMCSEKTTISQSSGFMIFFGVFAKSLLVPAWTHNHIPSYVWDEDTYPFTNFNGYAVEDWERYPCWVSINKLSYHREISNNLGLTLVPAWIFFTCPIKRGMKLLIHPRATDIRGPSQ